MQRTCLAPAPCKRSPPQGVETSFSDCLFRVVFCFVVILIFLSAVEVRLAPMRWRDPYNDSNGTNPPMCRIIRTQKALQANRVQDCSNCFA